MKRLEFEHVLIREGTGVDLSNELERREFLSRMLIEAARIENRADRDWAADRIVLFCKDAMTRQSKRESIH